MCKERSVCYSVYRPFHWGCIGGKECGSVYVWSAVDISKQCNRNKPLEPFTMFVWDCEVVNIVSPVFVCCGSVCVVLQTFNRFLQLDKCHRDQSVSDYFLNHLTPALWLPVTLWTTWWELNAKRWRCIKMGRWARQCWSVTTVAVATSSSWASSQPRQIPWWCYFAGKTQRIPPCIQCPQIQYVLSRMSLRTTLNLIISYPGAWTESQICKFLKCLNSQPDGQKKNNLIKVCLSSVIDS